MLPVSTAAENDQEKAEGKTGIWALDTLGEDETIAHLATGVKRFKLPDDQNTSSSISKSPTTWPTSRARIAELDAHS